MNNNDTAARTDSLESASGATGKRMSFDEELQVEVEERLALMEEPGYEFPATLKRSDWSFIIAIPIVCFILLIVGEFL